MLKGMYRNEDQDYPCIVKMAETEQDVILLTKEIDVLRTIRSRDLYRTSQRFIAGLLHPDQLMSDDGIYFFDENGGIRPHNAPLSGLVLECGEMNLKEYLIQNRQYISVGLRVEILSEIVEAVQFLHQIGFVHCDLKPENIVSFTSSSHDRQGRGGGGNKMRWKLVDFDSCVDESSPPTASLIDFQDFRVTLEYSAPEIIMAIQNELSSDSHSQMTTPAWSHSSRDIWSLGLIAYHLFTDQSFWSAYSRASSFHLSMISHLCQEEIDVILHRTLLCKEKSFVQSCLQINPKDRRKCRELLTKSLFSPNISTMQVMTLRSENETIVNKFEEFKIQLHYYLDQSPHLGHSKEELLLKCDEFSLSLASQLERVLPPHSADQRNAP
jgi:serine/threonine protein kinase